MRTSKHTIVIGGGIVGMATAYFLARRGERVTLFERSPTLDDSASAGNAGIIALGHPPLPRPGLPAAALKLFFSRTNPLYIMPRPSVDLARWLWGFRRACSAGAYERSMHVLAEMGWAAGECFRRLIEEEHIDGAYSATGWMEVFRTGAALKHGRAVAEMCHQHGYSTEEIDGRSFESREPAFRSGVAGAIHYVDSAFADPGRILVELAERARHHGADIQMATEVSSVDIDNGAFRSVTAGGSRIEGDTLVLAAGAWTTRLAGDIGLSVPMQPGKGYHLNLDRLDPAPSTVCVLAETFVAVTPYADRLRLSGTVELSGLNHRIVPKRLAMLRRGANAYLSGVDTLPEKSRWCGLRPCTADGLPIIGWAPGAHGVIVATGHAMMGFALGPVTGQIVSELILGDEPSMNIAPMSPSRFS